MTSSTALLVILGALVLALAVWRPATKRVLRAPGNTATLEDASLMADLRRAIADDALDVHYQPKLRVADGGIEGLEALVRWRHPSLGAISPSVFVPIAERTGHIAALTEWVIGRVLIDRGQLEAFEARPVIYVNVSADLIGDADFAHTLLSRLAPLDGSIGIEITETAVLSNPDCALRHLNLLAAARVKIAIDDYGVGLSSLAYLKQMPASELKLDGMFVTNLGTDHRDPMIVRSTIDLAHGLGLIVTAEGVECAEAFALLEVMGCDLVQGFGVAKPMAMREVCDLLRKHGPRKPFEDNVAFASLVRQRLLRAA